MNDDIHPKHISVPTDMLETLASKQIGAIVYITVEKIGPDVQELNYNFTGWRSCNCKNCALANCTLTCVAIMTMCEDAGVSMDTILRNAQGIIDFHSKKTNSKPN